VDGEYINEHGVADFHAAGRHSHITELIRSGVSLAEARELARHSDIRMTMRYTHIGMDDKAKAIKQLPWQRNGSDSGVSESQQMSTRINNRHSLHLSRENTNPCQSRGCDKDRHQLSLDDIDTDERRARDSNPQPVARQLISNQSASHSLTLRRAFYRRLANLGNPAAEAEVVRCRPQSFALWHRALRDRRIRPRTMPPIAPILKISGAQNHA
jgi:Phage integrase family